MKLIKFETAKLAKEKGFNIEYNLGHIIKHNLPTQSELQKWLREEHGIFVLIDATGYESPGNQYFIPDIQFKRGHKSFYTGLVSKLKDKFEDKMIDGKFKRTMDKESYEFALEQGLREALKLI